MTRHREAKVHDRQAHLERQGQLDRAGEATQREGQLRGRQVDLEQQEKELTRNAEAIRRQFIDLGDKHNFESLDPVRSAPIPYVDRVQDAESRRFRRYAWYAGTLGTAVAGGLFVATIAAPPAAVLPISLVLAALVGGAFTGVAIVSTHSNPRNPGARAKLIVWNNVFGTIAAASVLAILWLRFVSNVSTLQLIAIPISTFEMSMYALAGVFSALSALYAWSRDLTEEFQRVVAQRTQIQQELANVSVELMELEFHREMSREAETPTATSEQQREQEAK